LNISCTHISIATKNLNIEYQVVVDYGKALSDNRANSGAVAPVLDFLFPHNDLRGIGLPAGLNIYLTE
jgi:hypothetical protein